ELAERAEHDLRPELDRAGAAGVIPVRPAGLDLQLVDRRAAGFECRDGVGLGIEDADRRGIARPVPSLAFHMCAAAPHACRGAALVLRTVALIGARYLEQRHVGEA